MPTQERPKRRRRSRSRGKAFALVLLLMAVFFLVGGGVFFRVRNVEVIGSDEYTAEEILESSGVNYGDNLLFVSRSRISANLVSNLIYAESVQISRRLPGTLVIRINESIPVACVYQGGWWLVDKNCRVLEKTNQAGLGDAIPITGLAIQTPEVGEILSMDGEEEVTAQLLGEFLSAILETGLRGEIRGINAEYLSNITFNYQDRLTVRLGSAIHAAEKLCLMLQALEQLEPDARGSLDLSREKEARYYPE